MTDTAAARRTPPAILRASVLVAALAVAACFGLAITFAGTPTQAAETEAHAASE